LREVTVEEFVSGEALGFGKVVTRAGVVRHQKARRE